MPANARTLPQRYSCRAIESAVPWFANLLDAYAYLDASIERQLATLPGVPACRKGCFSCCSIYVPVLPPEIFGIHLYATLALLKPNLLELQQKDSDGQDKCYFLRQGQCAIYPVRPMGCRRYIVFGKQCAPAENPVETRPHDVFSHSQQAFLQALQLTSPAYTALGLCQPHETFSLDFFLQKTALINAIPWHTYFLK